MFFLIQQLKEKVIKIIYIEEALNIKEHITQKGGFFSSVQLLVIRNKNKKNPSTRCTRQSYVFSVLSTEKNLEITVLPTLFKENCSLLVKTVNGQSV